MAEPDAPRGAFAYRDFRAYQVARLLVSVGVQMSSVAIGWQVYDKTGSPLDLGWVGLAQFLPLFALALVTGAAADRYDRKRIAQTCLVTISIASVGLALVARRSGTSLAPVFALLVLLGVARAFYGPAASALLPGLVPREVFPSAVGWNSSTWQIAMVVGPALGGVLYRGVGPTGVYLCTALLAFVSALLVATLSPRAVERAPRGAALAEVSAGLAYVRDHPLLLGAITLDLFAVLLGGAVALLPALAKDHLGLGPRELGMLRAGPALGATVVALWLARRPLERHAGPWLFGAVALYGAFTVMLGRCTSFGVALAALVGLGASDMVSVFVRHTLVQLGTPDAMRGRVSAVNQVFIGASNELGEFESGLTAAWLGVAPAIVAGGLGTLIVVLVSALVFPALRRVDRLSDVTAADRPS